MFIRWLMLSWVLFAVLACKQVERRGAGQSESIAVAGPRASERRVRGRGEEDESALAGRAAVSGSADREIGARAPVLDIATLSACALPMPEAPPTECFDLDPTEPNDKDDPATLPLDTGCGYLEANISAGDEDGFAFTTLRSDPVLIELSYWASGEADLEQTIFSPTGSLLAEKRTTRTGEGEDLRSVIQSAADARYVVRVRDSGSSKSCQSYALRVDPLYCSDDYEDNDSLATAARLPWDLNERAAVVGALLDTDEDFFEVTTVRADPVHLTGSYSADATSTVQMSRKIYDGAGTLQTSASGSRDTDTETFSHWLPAPAKGSVLRTRLTGTGSGCATYDLQLDGAACTDAYEDNDNASEAVELAVGSDTDVTIYRTDEDHYALPVLAAGSCTLSYEVPTGRSGQLQLALYDGAGSLVKDKTGGELAGMMRTLKVSWTGNEVVRIKVVLGEPGYCQPYTLRCDAAAGQ